MKNIFKRIIFLILLSIPIATIAQPEIGLKFSPTLSVNRVSTESDTVNVDGSGLGIRFMFGPVLDFYLGKNYYFTTGLLYAPQRVSFDYNSNNGAEITETYNLQYLQIPVMLKLLTNEISLDKSIYFNIGFNGEFKINEKDADKENFIVEDFKAFNTSLHLGFGLEYRIGVSTRIQVGFGYNRGLINVTSNQINMDDKIVTKNDLLSLDFTLMF